MNWSMNAGSNNARCSGAMTQIAPLDAALGAAWKSRGLQRYACLGVLGAGGSGVVFRARDRRSGREVALKLPRAATAPQPWAERARVLREAEALRTVRHHNVVGLHEVGVVDGVAYLVMEALPAAPLAELRLAWPAALAVVRQVGAALAAVHAAGLLHRDVAPRNILVGATGRAWLIDFGSVCAIDPEVLGEGSFAALPLSGPGPGPGTPLFMAPEQRRGEPLDGRADQYGLCATLWWSITGAAPGTVCEALPLRLREVLGRGLEEQVSRRYPNMSALVAALTACEAA